MRSGTFKENYSDLIALTDSRWVISSSTVLVAALLVAPLLLSSYWISILLTILITIIGVMGLNLLSGTTGLISLGHAGFLAVGAYTTAILTADHGVSTWIAIPASGVVAAIFGLVVGIPSLRLKGLYLAITTMAFAIIINHVIVNAYDLTHGSEGIATPAATLLGITLERDGQLYYLALILVLLGLFGILNLMRSRIGRAFLAIREHDIAAKAMGINLVNYKLLAFMISAFYAGIAGSLLAYHIRYVNVDSFSFLVSIQAISMIIVGGLGSVSGSILGTVFIIFLIELLNLVLGRIAETVPALASYSLYELKGFIYGLTIVLFLRFAPEGLIGMWRDIRNYWQHWPFKY
ncbi:MAG: branched-chain amino acid ABC transporter permease [Pseudomonadales bacterium]|nr:branched-chain amino acid ABC transporter permease [Pseudomonadales bacterium]